MRIKECLILLILLRPVLSFGQVDSLRIQVRSFAVLGGNGYAPHWLVSNRSGLFSESDNDAALMPGFTLPWKIGKHVRVETGFDLALKLKLKESFIYQGYLNINIGSFRFIAGRQEYSMGQYGDSLSSGSFLISRNAKAIPRIGFGFYDYVDVPFTHGYLQVKGGISNGWLDDDRLHHSPLNKPMMHEKFAYIRTHKLPLNPFAGLGHVVLYGGEDLNGENADIDFLAVFLGKGSDKVSNISEALNAVGEHIGIVDIGIDFRLHNWAVTYFLQKPITDQNDYVENFSRNFDFLSGLVIENPGSKLISRIVYEMIQTEHQGGLGLPDPRVDGRLIVPYRESDIQYLKDYYGNLGYPVSNLNTGAQWISFLKAYINYGHEFGGRDDYYNNYLYTYVYKDRVIGTSLYLTKNELETLTGYADAGNFIVNNRITAHNLGIQGNLRENLRYRLMLTFTRNKGAWQEYGGPTSWGGIAVNPNYNWFWKGYKYQWYSLFETDFSPAKLPMFDFKLGLAYDFGDLNNNFGAIVGITYKNLINF